MEKANRILVLLFIWLSFCLSSPTLFQAHAAAAPKDTAEKGVDKKQPEPAKKPNGQQPGTVEINPERQQLIGVKKVEAMIQPLQKTIRTVGRIEYDESKLVTVNLKVEGWVERLYGDFTGKYVKKGEPLAEIYSPELLATQLEYINLNKWKRDKAHRFQRNLEFSWGDRYNTTGKMITFDLEALILVAQEKMRFWEITEEQIKKIEESGAPIRTFTLYSPINGYVLQKPAVQGKRVEPGEKLFDLVDLSTVWILSDIYVYELPLVRIGQTAKITISHFPGEEYTSKIDYIYPTISGETRTAKARFTVPNPYGRLKPQMFTSVELKVDLGRRLVIPEDAVIDMGARQAVYVDKGEGYFEPRQVTLGLRANGLVEVLKGIKEGEKIASAANFLIDSESKLKGVFEK